MIRTEHIIYKVKDKEILSDVGFHLQKGDFCAVVGMNGSGKSTLLKHLCRVVEPTSGDIFIKQKNIKKYSVKDLAKEGGNVKNVIILILKFVLNVIDVVQQ